MRLRYQRFQRCCLSRRLQSLQHSAQLEESADEYDPDAVSADEDMDANMDEDTIIM